MLKQLVTRVLLAAVVVAIPVVTAGPAAAQGAQGPANPQEAAMCKQLLAWAMPTGLTPTSINSVCTVKGNHG
ncbi:hypothetical protein [Kitasatospora sp. MAP5-34]|uniref:hypothetical protein n=1 Tax=Kitasatospora sp. MAP5-34 TaxID=3035102 RepID=UPI002474371B|nr:hypothetical protein [Kitasatospora sp. MAP5-34]MDH6577140.1 hypothetical protein [Kitasatospora sp. MAP5-34]